MRLRHPSRPAITVLLALLLCSCASGREYSITDPYETHNRRSFQALTKLDEAVYKPATYFYRDNFNDHLRAGLRNAINNIETSNHMVNDVLQLRFHRFFHDSARLLINSTAGVLGLIDVAAYLDLEAESNDFAKTLAHWGWRDSAMVVVPIYGPDTVRGIYGFGVEFFFLHPIRFLNFNLAESLMYTLIRGMNSREDLAEFDRTLNDPSIIDKYAVVREFYQQSRVIFIKRRDDVAVSEVIWSDDELDLLD